MTEPLPLPWRSRGMNANGHSKTILVIANETVADPALRGKILERARNGDSTVHVVCPALNSRFRHWCSDDDAARARAGERLDASLVALWSEEIAASGEIGDADPVVALQDGLARYRPDEVIVSTHPPGRSNWLEKGVVEKARALAAPLPVFHVVASGVATGALKPAAA
jgi:hypothetical protein